MVRGFQRVSARLNMNIALRLDINRLEFPACLCTAKYEYNKPGLYTIFREFPACLCTAKYEY